MQLLEENYYDGPVFNGKGLAAFFFRIIDFLLHTSQRLCYWNFFGAYLCTLPMCFFPQSFLQPSPFFSLHLDCPLGTGLLN